MRICCFGNCLLAKRELTQPRGNLLLKRATPPVFFLSRGHGHLLYKKSRGWLRLVDISAGLQVALFFFKGVPYLGDG